MNLHDRTLECLHAFLAHTVDQLSLREIAAQSGYQPSTIMRRVRRIEDLTDHADWNSAVAVLSNWHKGLFARPLGLSEPDVIEAFGLEAPGFYRLLGASRQVLEHSGGSLLMGDEAMAVAMANDNMRFNLARKVALAAMVLGYIEPLDKGERKVRRFGPAVPLQTVTPDGRKLTLGVDIMAEARRYRTGGESRRPLERLRLTHPDLFTAERVSAGRAFCELYAMRETATRQDYEVLANSLGPVGRRIMEMVCGEGVGLETAEQQFGLPNRSAKAVLAILLDQLHHTQAEAA